MLPTEFTAFVGDGRLEAVIVTNTGAGASRKMRTESVVVLTGNDLPRSDTPAHLESSVPGVLAAGDTCSGSVKGVASAVGEGAMAVTFARIQLAKT